jgi:hypothetical protein
MKYLKLDELFMAVGTKGDPFLIDGVGATKTAVLGLALRCYQPMDGGRTLILMAEIRSYNKVLDILENPPQEAGYYRFEDLDYIVMKKVVTWTVPQLPWFRQAPALEDILNGAVDAVPAPIPPAPDGVAKQLPEPLATPAL